MQGDCREGTGGASRNRTDVHGFAIRCITTLPLRQHLQEKRKRGVGRCFLFVFGAGDESRTRDLNLGKVALYQLSYSRGGTAGYYLLLLSYKLSLVLMNACFGIRAVHQRQRLYILLRVFARQTEIWSGRRVSNSRPQPWQGCALPTELLPHLLIPSSLAVRLSLQEESSRIWRLSNQRGESIH